MLWAYLAALLIIFYAFSGWWGARTATVALPPRDLRTRPANDIIEEAEALLRIKLPASDHQIRAASRALYTRCMGDTFEDGTPRHLKIHDIMEAADLLIAVNEFDANPPLQARFYLAYWQHRAGILGRLWGTMFPPKVLIQLRSETAVQA